MAQRYEGVLRTWTSRGFGFIRLADGDVAVDQKAFARAGIGGIRPGDRFSFEIVERPDKGRAAVNMKLVERAVRGPTPFRSPTWQRILNDA